MGFLHRTLPLQSDRLLPPRQIGQTQDRGQAAGTPADVYASRFPALDGAADLTKKAARDLLDVSLPDSDVEWISGFVKEKWPQVRSFHRLRTRKAGSDRFIDFHLVVDDEMSAGEAHALGDEIVVAIMERLPESHVHIHVEPCAFECAEVCESGCSVPTGKRHKHEEG